MAGLRIAQTIAEIVERNCEEGKYGEWIIGTGDDEFDVKCSKCEWTDIFEVAGIAAVERIAKTFCDRCGEEIAPKYSVTYAGVRRGKYDISDDYELCVSCAHELKLWLNGKKGGE